MNIIQLTKPIMDSHPSINLKEIKCEARGASHPYEISWREVDYRRRVCIILTGAVYLSLELCEVLFSIRCIVLGTFTDILKWN